MYNSHKRWAIHYRNRDTVKKMCPSADDSSGIYVFTRTDEYGINHFYVGQAKKLQDRLAQHLPNTEVKGNLQHIDASIRKHGLWKDTNPSGWRINIVCHCAECDLDNLEQEYILKYLQKGYQTLNKTYGSQGEGKVAMDNQKPRKGYNDGKLQGYTNAQKEVAELFKKNLSVVYNKDGLKKDGSVSKAQEKAMQKFKEFLEVEEND